jgi:S1-C subfamily serine protease
MADDAPSLSVLSMLSRDLRALVARVAPSVVSVTHRRGQGSGLVLAQDGFLLTNCHVAQRARGTLRVGLADGREFPADLVGEDAASNLAVLRVPASGLPTLRLADSSQLGIGQIVVAVGNPLRFERSVSLGVISAIDRSLPASADVLLEGLIQTDAAVNPGNSGGPLVDTEGAVVGINTAMIPYAQGIGFAVPAQTANWVAAILIQKGRVQRPYFGIAARSVELAPAMAADVGSKRAVLVAEVKPNTPASRAGLIPGDPVWLADGQRVGLIDDLQRIAVLGGMQTIELDLRRRERNERIVVELA